MQDEIKTKVRAGGLRYQSKSPGTAFAGPFGGTMSCILCSRHMPRSRLESFRLAGNLQYRCRDGC
ncbi:hypothetical protein HHL11_02120 [Ramlibacter sp. G-1-2-2]|uniref:Uncharacterized protein n=1 Tax=Ramlibacter agri TaxID=2728837 RepID=A0A848GWL9_9BURK|nr:hypothetical protein [Ramlibacter agri]NML42527.1 hypothetical protein [Ramlibacter agri]